MIKLVLMMSFILVSSIVYAQKKSPTEKAKIKTEELQKDLQLTPDQNKKIYDINVKAYNSIAEYETKKPSKKLKKKQKDIVQNMRDDQYKKILTSAQYKKYKDIKKKEKEEAKKLEAMEAKDSKSKK